ncbi:glycosyltransferase family 2 protein [soil metagenome]
MIIPIKDEQDNLAPLHDRLTQALKPLGQSYELLFVDDGSVDRSFHVLETLAKQDDHVKVVRLRRNYGQTPALQAGIDWSQGEIIITMDGDLQNDPADIPLLLKKLDEGYDAVLGLRANRQDHLFIRKIPSFLGNWLIRHVTGVHIKDMGCTLRALRRDLAEELPLYGELHRFVPVLAQQLGGRLAQIPVRHHPRVAGKTKYNLTRTVRVVLDLITVKFMHSYVTRPMHVMGMAGLVSFAGAGLSLMTTVVMKWWSHIFWTGNPFLYLSILCVLVGFQFVSMGLIGEVLTRTYFESQGKSAYSIRTLVNVEPRIRRKVA